MFEQRFVRRCLLTACAFFLTSAIVVLSLLGGGGAAQAQDQQPAPHVQNSTLYFPIVGKGPKIAAPAPAPGAINQSPNVYLAWHLVDSYTPDPRFTVFLEAGDDTPDVVVAQNLAASAVDPATLANDTVYYWQVVLFGSNGETEFGPVWSFRTEPWYDPPPIGSMVDVPAGPFWMGCDMNNHGFGDGCNDKDMPLHKVWLSAYAIDKYEVTNVEYRACVQAGACSLPRKGSSHERNDYYRNHRYNLYPVLYVSRDNAIQYCTWAGKRLPTEAEWEKAARGPIDTRPFPWGSEDPDCTTQNRPDENKCEQDLDTTRAGSFPRGASPYGALDMAGNVFEWVVDKADWSWYRITSSVNPVNPPASPNDFTVIRSGSYRDRFSYLRTYHRHSGHYGDFVGQDAPYFRNDRTGFRCAKSLP